MTEVYRHCLGVKIFQEIFFTVLVSRFIVLIQGVLKSSLTNFQISRTHLTLTSWNMKQIQAAIKPLSLLHGYKHMHIWLCTTLRIKLH